MDNTHYHGNEVTPCHLQAHQNYNYNRCVPLACTKGNHDAKPEQTVAAKFPCGCIIYNDLTAFLCVKDEENEIS